MTFILRMSHVDQQRIAVRCISIFSRIRSPPLTPSVDKIVKYTMNDYLRNLMNSTLKISCSILNFVQLKVSSNSVPEWISEMVLRRLMQHGLVVCMIRVRNKDQARSDPSTIVYQQGKPYDFFTLILEVIVGHENLSLRAVLLPILDLGLSPESIWLLSVHFWLNLLCSWCWLLASCSRRVSVANPAVPWQCPIGSGSNIVRWSSVFQRRRWDQNKPDVHCGLHRTGLDGCRLLPYQPFIVLCGT